MAAVETIDLSIQLPPSDRLRGSNLQQFHPQTDFLAYLLSSPYDNAILFTTRQFSETHDAEIEATFQKNTPSFYLAEWAVNHFADTTPQFIDHVIKAVYKQTPHGQNSQTFHENIRHVLTVYRQAYASLAVSDRVPDFAISSDLSQLTGDQDISFVHSVIAKRELDPKKELYPLHQLVQKPFYSAILSHLTAIKNPLEYVRKGYSPHVKAGKTEIDLAFPSVPKDNLPDEHVYRLLILGQAMEEAASVVRMAWGDEKPVNKENLLQRSTIMKVFAPLFIRQLQESLPLAALQDQSVAMAAQKLRDKGPLSIESVVQSQLGVLPQNNAFSRNCTNGFYPWSAKWIIQAALLKDLTLEDFHQVIPQEDPPLWMIGKK